MSADEERDTGNKSDHDLLVEIHTTLTNLIVPTVNDHGHRIRKLETAKNVAIGSVAVLGGTGLGSIMSRLLGGGG